MPTSTGGSHSQSVEPAVHSLACFRHSPRPCINQALVDELKPLKEWRFLNHGTSDHRSISYARAISAIIGTPFLITSEAQARQIPYLGEKLVGKIGEFLETGQIQESRDKLASVRMKQLKDLSTVYGIGYSKAGHLIDDDDIHTVEQLSTHPKHGKTYKIGIKYREDMETPMTREDVELVADFIRIQLEKVEPGAHTVLCGGYRRGKDRSNDLDMVITYPHEDGKERGVLRHLIHRLKVKGFVPEDGVLYFSTPASHRTTEQNLPASSFDSLDRAFILFKQFGQVDSPRTCYRRVDLIVSRWPTFGSAVVGWSGSTQFERDLRTHAHSLGYKFESGGLRTRNDNQPVPAVTEKDVFRALKLPWIPPHLRNAD